MAEGWNDFDNYGLQEMIRDLWQAKETGVLNSEIGGFEKTVYFREGVVQFAASDDPNDKLPVILIGKDHFTEEQFESAQETFKDDISVGRNLVEHGLISQQELVEGAKGQVYHICTQMLRAEQGRSRFKEGPLPEGVVSLPMTFPDGLIDAVLGMEDKSWIGTRFGPSLDFICEKNADKPLEFDQIELPDYAESIYELLDGERDFNHLAFEVEVDDFVLLKFLYALKYLGYAQIKNIPHDEDEEPDIGDVRDELSDALSQSDDIDKLGAMSLDETVEMSALQGLGDDDPLLNGGSLDATMEISKDALANAEPALRMDADLDDEPELDELDDFPDDDEEVAESEEEEEGLDDLGDMDSDIFEEELAKMAPRDDVEIDEAELPRGAEADDGLDEDEDEDETGFEDDVDEGAEKRKKILIAATIATLIISGLLLLGKPYIVKLFPPHLELADQLVEEEPLAGDPTMPAAPPDSDETIPEDEPAAVADTAPEGERAGGETTPESTPPPEPADSAADTTSQPDPQPQVVVENDPEPPPADTTPKPQPREPVADPEPETAEPVVVQTPPPDPAPAMEDRKPAPDGIRLFSPVAEGWDPDSGKPKGSPDDYADASLRKSSNLGPTAKLLDFGAGSVVGNGATTTDPNVSAPAAAPVADNSQPAVNNPQPAATEPKPTVRVTDTAPAGPRVAPATGPVQPREQLKQLQAGGAFAEAAAGWRNTLVPDADKYTLALFLACQESSVTRAFDNAGADHQLYVLPKSFNGRACYYVCWGSFESHFQALAAIKSLPAFLRGDAVAVTVGSKL